MIPTPQSELLESFLLDAWDALSSFDSALESLADPSKLKNLSVVTHRLKGTAALYGFEQIAKLCELTERFLSKSDRFSEQQFDTVHLLLQQVSAVLGASLESIARTGKEGQVGLQFNSVGGAKLLTDLIKTQPELFVEETHRTKTIRKNSISQSLQQFYREHQEDWSFFAPEAEEILELIELSLDDLKTDEVRPDVISRLFRATHTLKGAAYMVGLEAMGDLAHQLEDLMVRVRDNELALSGDAISCLKEGSFVLGLMLDTARGRQTNLESELTRLKQKLAKVLGTPYSEAEDSKSELALSLESFYQTQQDVWDYFAPEVKEHLDVAHLALDSLRQNLSDEEALQTLFRAMHTIKGAAYMVELMPLGDVAADLEALCRLVKEEGLELDDSILESLAKGRDVLDKLMLLAGGNANDAEEQLGRLQQSLESYLPQLKSRAKVEQENAAPNTKKLSTVRVNAEKLDTLMDLAGDLISLRSRMAQQLERLGEVSLLMEASRNRMLRTLSEFENQYLNPQLRQNQTVQTSSVSPSKARISGSLQEMFDELEFDTYNDLNILARSVSEMASDISELGEELSSYYKNSQDENERLQGISKQLRQEISRARMVPISQLYGLLKRLLRNSGNKAYRLETLGENVELDNTILEAVSDSMLHLVRNAISHGIEARDERITRGKTAEGLIQLKAFHRGNHVYLEVQDDGAGLNVERLKQKALEKGFKTAQELEQMSFEESCQLIFIPGLSTAQAVSTDAGRGVGMDAVASAVKRLKGEISLHTELGKGTRFTLKLPLTLLISDALLVKVADQTFAFGSDSIETLQRLSQEHCPVVDGKRMISYQDKTLELLDLRQLFGFPERELSEEFAIVITQAERQTFAFIVDEHLDLSEVVIRELNPALAKLEHLSNATLAPNGEIILLLDPVGLSKLSQHKNKIETAHQRKQPSKAKELLLVDDSLSVRRVIGKMLEKAGYQVTTAGDGQEAFDLLVQKGLTQNGHFDAILSDLEMPRMNGYELLEEVRRRPETQATPVIIMTTRAGDKHRNVALELGATLYFSKPVDELTLVTALSQVTAQESL